MINKFFIKLIDIYQFFLSPFLGKQCRFYPSCSHYSKEALSKCSFHKAVFLSIKRVVKCQPLSAGGIDDLEGRML